MVQRKYFAAVTVHVRKAGHAEISESFNIKTSRGGRTCLISLSSLRWSLKMGSLKVRNSENNILRWRRFAVNSIVEELTMRLTAKRLHPKMLFSECLTRISHFSTPFSTLKPWSCSLSPPHVLGDWTGQKMEKDYGLFGCPPPLPYIEKRIYQQGIR